jgi:hypothetical protein
MSDEFKLAKEHAKELEQADATRNLMLEEMEKIYWMQWGEEGTVRNQMKNIKVTRSPRARNALIGAKRLLTSTDPVISVPFNINDMAAQEKSEQIKKFASAMLFASGRIAGTPIHLDAVHSALLYADIVIGINSTKEMLEQASRKNPAIRARLEEIHNRTPILFEIYNPKGCHQERGVLGMTAFTRSVNTTVGAVQDLWGDDGLKALRSNKDKKILDRIQPVTLKDYYDLQNRFVWMDGYDKPIKEIVHKKPFIPVAYGIAEGSNLFDKPEEQREPFLWTAYKSGIIDRENLTLTTLYTMIFALGANPMFVDFLIDPDNPHPPDYSVPGGTVHYRIGEKREVMTKQIIDPAMMDGWNIANELEMQSTIYRQPLGEPVSASMPYSSLSVLTQSGRLPLIGPQRMAGNTIAEALEIALKWVKSEGVTARTQYKDVTAELSPDQIPDMLDIDVHLDVDLPQDQVAVANAANMLAQGDNPMVSHAWVLENMLHIGQPSEMMKQIWDEQTSSVFQKQYMYQQLAQLAQMQQMAMQPQGSMGSGVPGGKPTPQIPNQGAMPQPNFGTPAQPTPGQGPPPVPPVEPMPSQMPNQIPR